MMEKPSNAAEQILSLVRLKNIAPSDPPVKVGQVVLVLDPIGTEEDTSWVLLCVSEVSTRDFTYGSYSDSGAPVGESWVSFGRRPFEDVVAVYEPKEALEMEAILRRFEKSQERVRAVYCDARQAFLQAVRRQDDTAMTNLLQGSEKLDNEIEDLVSKFGVNVALFKES